MELPKTFQLIPSENFLLSQNEKIDAGPTPPDFSSKLISLVTPVLFDSAGWTKKFGDCTQQPPPTVAKGEKIIAKFVSGHPRNNLMQGKSFLRVEKQVGDKWIVVATDANWETKFIWKRTSIAGSETTIEWEIGNDTDAGIYRIRHSGYYKHFLGGIYPYEGLTRNCRVM